MPLLPVYNERSAFDLDVTMTDSAGDPLSPTAAYYTVYDVTGGTTVKAWTQFSVDGNGQATLEIEPADVAMVNASNEYEERSVIVSAEYGTGKEYNDEYRFRVKNLYAVPRT